MNFVVYRTPSCPPSRRIPSRAEFILAEVDSTGPARRQGPGSHSSRPQLVPEPPHNRHHPALVHREPKPERIRIIEPRRPRLHDAPVRLVRLERDARDGLGARDLLQRGDLLAHGRREAGKTDDARVREECGAGHTACVEEVRDRRLGAGHPELEIEFGGVGRAADGACAGETL